jgi:DNA invertase Pin-like site-specific DNA recombinase/transposase
MTSEFKTGADLPTLWLPSDASVVSTPPVEPARVCVIYARYSTSNQKEASIERQVADCQLYIKEHGLQLIDTYADRGVTGTTDQRAELMRLLEDAKKGRFTHIVVESLDRMSRKLSLAVKIFEELIDLGIVLHDAEENRPLSIMDIGHKGAASQAARDLLVKRGQAGIRRNAAAGAYGNAHCFGYERAWDPQKQALVWKVNTSEAALVVEAFQLYVSGVSAARIAKIFNDRAAAERGDRNWTRNFLVGSAKLGTGLLRRLRYIGLRVQGKTKLTKHNGPDGKKGWSVTLHPISHWVIGNLEDSFAIIDRSLFDQAQELLKKRSDAVAQRKPWARFTAKHAPLGGLFRCIHCNSGMTPTLKRRDGKPRILCNRARNNNGCNNTHTFTLESVEDEVHRLLTENLGSAEASITFAEEYNKAREQRIADAASKKAALERARSHAISLLNRIREDERDRRYPGDYLEVERIKAVADYEKIERRLTELTNVQRMATKEMSATQILDGHRLLLDSLSNVFSREFDGASETGTKVKAALHHLIHSIVLDIDERGCSVHLKCRLVLGLSDDDDSFKTFTSRIERNGGSWQSSIREVRRIADLAESGTRSVTDEEWHHIAHLVPDAVARSRRRTGSVDKRSIVNAALLHLWEGVPLKHMPEIFGTPEAVFAALKRLSESGGWDAVVDKLRAIAPHRIPDTSSNMFPTIKGRNATSLKGLPLIRAQNGTKAANGLHAPNDQEWQAVRKLIPEQILQVNKQPAPIEPRTFLHGFLFWLNEGIPLSHLPLAFGSERFFNHALQRLAGHGLLDELVQTLLALSPSPLASDNLPKLDRFPRDISKSAVWRRALPKRSDMEGVPEHFLNDQTWRLVQHLFPPEFLFVNGMSVVKSPQRLAHAILYRIKERIPFRVMPFYFGPPREVELIAIKWVAHHLWDEFKRILQTSAPEVLRDADLTIFNAYRRSKTFRYRHLMNADRQPIPPHLPSDADFELMKDLVPEEILCIRGGPAVLDPSRFFHALVFMMKEHSLFGRLPLYFGSNHDVRVITRRFVFHHYWDAMKARIQHFEPRWTNGADLTLFDHMKRSSNPEPGFRRRPSRPAVQ